MSQNTSLEVGVTSPLDPQDRALPIPLPPAILGTARTELAPLATGWRGAPSFSGPKPNLPRGSNPVRCCCRPRSARRCSPCVVTRRRRTKCFRSPRDGFAYIVKAAAKKAGLGSHVSPHSLRHAHASHAIENGASIALVSATLGHSDLKVTSVYAHARPEDSSSRFLKR
jgi:hypothetical protein